MPDKDYSRVALAKKLGLLTTKPLQGEVAFLGAPAGFRESLGELPEIAVRARVSPRTILALAFVRTPAELEALMEMLAASLPKEAHVWVIHPKARHKPAFNQNDVRDAGLAVGLVDYKICSVDDDWSAIKFAWRKQER